MLQVSKAIQFQPRDDKDAYRSLGIIYIPARQITDAGRGISYQQQAGFFAQTWMGNIQMVPGDWLVTCGRTGNRYVVKEWDYDPSFDRPSWLDIIKLKLFHPLRLVK